MKAHRIFSVLAVFLILVSSIGGIVVAGAGVASAEHKSDDNTTETATETGTETESTPTSTETPTSTHTDESGDSDSEQKEQTSDSDNGDDVDTGDWTISELREGGTTYSDSPPSARIVDQSLFWVIHWPADEPWTEPGEDRQWDFLSPGEDVGRNSVWLRTIKTTGDTETRDLHIVYWQTREKTVKQGNTTTTKTVLTNVTHVEKKVEFGRGWPMQRIDLRQHDQKVHVTMWMESAPNDARWTFTHKSIATTEDADISSMGDYWINAAIDFLIPILFGSFIIGFVVRAAIKKAGIGPQWGYVPWIILLTIVTGASVLWAYDDLASLLVNLPKVASGFIVALIGIIMLETYSTDVDDVLFLRPNTTDAVSPSGEEAVDMIALDGDEYQLVDMDDGRTAVVKPGFFPFLARVAGGVAELENLDNIRSRVKMPDSEWDEAVYVDADADDILDYEQEGWTLDIPSIEDNPSTATALFGGVGLSSWIAIQSLPMGDATAIVAAVAAVAFVRPRDGYARVDPAPAHTRSAHANQIQLNKDYDEARTLDESRQKIWELESKNQRDVEEVVDNRDSTLIEEMLAEDSDSRSVLPDDDEKAAEMLKDALNEDDDEQ